MKYTDLKDKAYNAKCMPANKHYADAIADIANRFAGKQWRFNASNFTELDKQVKRDIGTGISTSTLRRHGVLRYEIINNVAYAAIRESRYYIPPYTK